MLKLAILFVVIALVVGQPAAIDPSQELQQQSNAEQEFGSAAIAPAEDLSAAAGLELEPESVGTGNDGDDEMAVAESRWSRRGGDSRWNYGGDRYHGGGGDRYHGGGGGNRYHGGGGNRYHGGDGRGHW